MTTLTLKNLKSLSGSLIDLNIQGPRDEIIDAEGKLTALPALIDPHVHFRTPGQTYKEDYISGAKAALAGGVTRVFDMPDNEPLTVTEARLDKKIAQIEEHLKEAKIPLRYNLFFGADEKTFLEIPRVKNKIVGIQLHLGSSLGNMTLENTKALDRLFQIAAEEELIISVQGEDQKTINVNQDVYKHSTDVRSHSMIRSTDASLKALEKALDLSLDYSTEIYVTHVSSREEIDLIREAKMSQQLVWLEASLHYLFLTDEDYETLGTKIQVNPPLRSKSDQWALWEAVIDGTVDTIGTDHSPHTLQEKARAYPQSPSGIPGIEMRLPLLLNAASKGQLSLNRIIELCRTNIESIFQIPTNEDYVLVDLSLVKNVSDAVIKSKCGWSPYEGRSLKGWPIYTILKGEAFRVDA